MLQPAGAQRGVVGVQLDADGVPSVFAGDEGGGAAAHERVEHGAGDGSVVDCARGRTPDCQLVVTPSPVTVAGRRPAASSLTVVVTARCVAARCAGRIGHRPAFVYG